jgi:hypothetical protein
LGQVVDIHPYRERKGNTMPGMQELTELAILKKQIVTLRNSIDMMATYIDRESAVIRISELQMIIVRREDKIRQGL